MFGTGEKSFEKYESGQIKPSEPTKRLLCLAMIHPELFHKRAAKTLKAPARVDSQLVRRTIHKVHLDRFYAPLFESARDN